RRHDCGARDPAGSARCGHQYSQGSDDFRPRRQVGELWRADGGNERPARRRISQARPCRARNTGRKEMTALALHLPQQRGLSRWALAASTIVLAHALLVACIVLGYARRPVEPPVVLPAIAVSLLPVEASSPEIQNQDIAVGPAMQEAEEAPKPKDEEKKLEQQPLPPQQDDIALPQVQEKKIETKR